MGYLGYLDVAFIVGYFLLIVVLGALFAGKASSSMEDFFIGGRALPWWALGISGMASFLDISGTMIIVSFLFLLGPRGLFVEFRGGAVLILPFMLLWAGKWHRRSQCLTGAEWMIFRFGDGPGGRFAQLAAVAAKVISTIGVLAYLVIGVGSFLSMFLPFSPLLCALLLLGAATVYTMASGFYGVVYTDICQALIILIAIVGISAMAVLRLGEATDFGALAVSVTGNADWMGSLPQWTTPMPRGYEAFEHLILFSLFYLMRNVFIGMAHGDDPKYFGARSDRECGLLTFLWTWLITLRWPMMMAFAVLGIFLVSDLFPDQSVLTHAADLIKTHHPDVTASRWGALLSSICTAPESHPPELVFGLRSLLGAEDWADKLRLVSFWGTVQAESILPAVLRFCVMRGFRGLLLVALVAAAMSTFDSTVNTTTGLFTRDVYQKYIRPRANTRELIHVSRLFVLIIVALGFLFAYGIQSINEIWGWIIMGLGAGLLVPTFLRLYWWRFNGGGFAVGVFSGIFAAVLQRLILGGLDDIWKFSLILPVGLLGSVIGTYLTKPTDRAVLERFYRTTRPFGFWGPLKESLPPEIREETAREHKNDIVALPFTLLWQVTLFLMPMQLIIGTYTPFWVTAGLFSTGLAGMYFFWYRHLPSS